MHQQQTNHMMACGMIYLCRNGEHEVCNVARDQHETQHIDHIVRKQSERGKHLYCMKYQLYQH